MPDQFTFEVTFNNEQHEFTATIIRLSYAYQLQIDVNNQKLFFEPDDSREYRLVKMPWQKENDIKQIDPQLIQVIIETLNTMHR